MAKEKDQKGKVSEFRQDPVAGDWVLIASNRAQRPHAFSNFQEDKDYLLKKNCPFEKPIDFYKPFLVYPSRKNWRVAVFQNKYPAVTPQNHKNCPLKETMGFFSKVEGFGYHDLILTRDHHLNFSKLSLKEAFLVFKIFQDRYLMLAEDKCLAYISIFHNWGKAAGASIYHPHYQLMALPIIPPKVSLSLKNALSYFERYKKCIHCLIIENEKKEKQRIIFENKKAIVFLPYASKEPFEFRVFLKKHSPYFEETKVEDLKEITRALTFGLKKLEKKIRNIAYNFFIHTAPLKEKEKYRFYHWHIEVVPQLNISAGFELSTGIEVNVVEPEKAALILKS